MSGGSTDSVAGADEIDALIDELAADLSSRLRDASDPCLIGVQRRGDTLARRLRSRLRRDDPDSIPGNMISFQVAQGDFRLFAFVEEGGGSMMRCSCSAMMFVAVTLVLISFHRKDPLPGGWECLKKINRMTPVVLRWPTAK
jgi:hypothetical protein